MTAQPKRNRLELTEEERQKVASLRRAVQEGPAVEAEWLEIAEFGEYYNWAGIMAILNNEIDTDVQQMLLYAGRKRAARRKYDMAEAVLVGTAAAHSKSPSTVFKRLTSKLVKIMRSDS